MKNLLSYITLTLMVILVFMGGKYSSAQTTNATNEATTCLDITAVFGNQGASICFTGETTISGFLSFQSTLGSDIADVYTESPFESHIRFYLVENGEVPQAFSPGNLATAQTPLDVVNEIEHQYSMLGVSKVGTPQVTIDSLVITGATFLTSSTSFHKTSVLSYFSYWSISVDNGFLIIELEEPHAFGTPMGDIVDVIGKYSNLSINIHQMTPVFLPIVTSNTAGTSHSQLSENDKFTTSVTATDLPFPSWWNGECNVNNHSGSYSRRTYRGVHSCGPNGQTVLVRFFPGAWGEYEWQCVELVMRYMYLAYGISPYQGNGNQVYTNYLGETLRKVPNKSFGEYPKEGDVVSFGGGTYGHAAIVIESSVDSNGNGYYKTFNQNWKVSPPIATYYVRGWDTSAIGWLTAEAESPEPMRLVDTMWYLNPNNAESDNTNLTYFQYGLAGDIPVIGDWDGDGIDTVGVFRPSDTMWYLNPNNAASDNSDLIYFQYGLVGDIPVVGDWDGDGIDTVGVFRPSNTTWYLNPNNAASDNSDLTVFQYGLVDDIPIVGDWEGDGIDTVGVFRPSNATWYLNPNNAESDNSNLTVFQYGFGTDIPVVGDWNNDGIDTVGVFRPSNAVWYLNPNNAVSDGNNLTVFQYGIGTDVPLTGDWNNDNQDTVGVAR